jgi:GAF domain-containing protein
MAASNKIEAIKKEIATLAYESESATALMTEIVELLQSRMLKYNWVGFYMLRPKSDPPMLVLGPYKGAMTPHTHIPLNQGICGAAASTGKTVVVDDVSKDPRYLACSVETKSEIVAPIFAGGKVVGELDIDSHFLSAFKDEDRELTEHCAAIVGKFVDRHPS